MEVITKGGKLQAAGLRNKISFVFYRQLEILAKRGYTLLRQIGIFLERLMLSAATPLFTIP
jgi:hypothetical protein